MRAVVIDLDRTYGQITLASRLRHEALEIEARTPGGQSPVADDMRYIADQIDDQRTGWMDRI